MTTATQIADWLVKYRADDAGAPIDAMSLEKHLFYAQGFFLATEHEALFLDEIQAWRDGPVVPEVWKRYSNYGNRPIAAPVATQNLSNKVEDFLCDVVSFLAPHTAIALSDATHAEDPWLTARKPYRRWEPSNVPLPREGLHTYFATLIDEGENALSSYALLDGLAEPRWGWLYVAGICSRRMVRHPFYICGTALWKEKLWDKPVSSSAYPVDSSRPPRRRNAAEERKIFTTMEEFDRLSAALPAE